MTEQVSPPLKALEDLIKDLVWDVTIEAQLQALFAAAPWLSVWPLRQFVTMIAHMVGDRIYVGLRTFVDLQAVPFINGAHRATFDRAVVTLKIIARDRGIESEEFKNAKEEARRRMADLVRFNG